MGMIRAAGLGYEYLRYEEEGQEPEVTKAIEDVSLEIQKGQFIAVLGHNGSGKSTLLNILGLLDKQTDGDYYIDGKKVSSIPEREKAKLRNSHIGFVMQDFALVEKHTVKQNINIPLIYTDKPINKEKAINDVLKSVGLSDKTNTPAYKLSGGQKQRVAIARAVVNEPQIILADEPTGALDSMTADEIMQIFERLNMSGKTVIIVTHDKDIAARCKRVIELSDGEIAKGTN